LWAEVGERGGVYEGIFIHKQVGKFDFNRNFKMDIGGRVAWASKCIALLF
jgi:hypothetical protein